MRASIRWTFSAIGDFKDGRFSAEIIGNRINISSLDRLMLDPL